MDALLVNINLKMKLHLLIYENLESESSRES